MSLEVIATVLTAVGVLVGVWRLVEGVRRDLTAQIAAVDTRVDDILLADRVQESRHRRPRLQPGGHGHLPPDRQPAAARATPCEGHLTNRDMYPGVAYP